CMEAECGLIVTEENGVVVDVNGNPDCLGNEGTMCPRGKSIILSLYNPYRIKAPMKRTNPKKGFDEDPGWVEISWDEALDTVADVIRPIIKENPLELCVSCGFALMDFWLGILIPVVRKLGFSFTGVPGAMCAVHYAVCIMQGAFPTGVPDYIHGKYVISVGKNAGASNAIATDGVSRGFANALAGGMRHISVDPKNDMDGSMVGCEWVPIKPGEDVAFLLSMLHSMMYENEKKDDWFLKNRTNGPYLVENGEQDYFRGSDGKPMMWDLDTNSAKAFDDPAFSDGSFRGENVRKIALEGEFSIGDTKVKTGYTLIKESIKDYTPDWAEGRCTIPAAKIRSMAKEFIENANIGGTIVLDGVEMPLRQSSINLQKGSCNHEDGFTADLLAKLICEMVGALDVPGGNNACTSNPMALEPDEDGVVYPVGMGAGRTKVAYPPETFSLKDYFPHFSSDNHFFFENMLDPESKGVTLRPKALLVMGTNSISSCADPQVVAKAISEKIPFSASFAYDMDEHAWLSDILLPVHSGLESMTIAKNFGPQNAVTPNCVTNVNQSFRDPVDPIYNTKLAQDLLMELLDRVGEGMLYEFNSIINERSSLVDETNEYYTELRDDLKLDPNKLYKMEDIWDRTLRSYYGDEYTIDYMREHGIIDARVPLYESYNYNGFPENQTRHTFYLHAHWRNGQKIINGIHEEVPSLDLLPYGVDLDRIKDAYQPIPVWRETYIMKEKEGFDLRLFNFKMTTAIFRFGIGDTNPWLTEWSEKYNPYFNVLMMNTETAKAKGLKSGDMVVIECSEDRSIEGKLLVTELIHPEAVGIGGAHGRMHKALGKGANSKTLFYNKLLVPDLMRMDPVTTSIEGTVNVKVTKK
ncbi:MAG TPA: molybdopterin-dependent oxidoreductase, partial [Syntrophomonadaceae bacterium]|nr:molybdopterin-dependent oxidoreductase [Syntrophomonadaceae bacterium]